MFVSTLWIVKHWHVAPSLLFKVTSRSLLLWGQQGRSQFGLTVREPQGFALFPISEICRWNRSECGELTLVLGPAQGFPPCNVKAVRILLSVLNPMFTSCHFMSARERKSPTDIKEQQDLSYPKKDLWRILVLDVSSGETPQHTEPKPAHAVVKLDLSSFEGGRSPGNQVVGLLCGYPFPNHLCLGVPGITLSVPLFRSLRQARVLKRDFQARMKYELATEGKEQNGASLTKRMHVRQSGFVLPQMSKEW